MTAYNKTVENRIICTIWPFSSFQTVKAVPKCQSQSWSREQLLSWLIRPMFDLHGRWQYEQGTHCCVIAGLASNFLSWRFCSCFACCECSYLQAPLLRSTLQVERSSALISQPTSGSPKSSNDDLHRSLKRSLGLPLALCPSHSSPYSTCFGRRWSFILFTWPSQRSLFIRNRLHW